MTIDPLAIINLTPAQIALALLIVYTGATTQAAAGFGFALITAPLLALIDLDFVPGVILLASLPLALLMVVNGRHAVDRSSLPGILVGQIGGSILGALLLLVVNPAFLPGLFGAAILSAVLLSAIGVTVAKTRGNLLLAGLLSGIMGVMSGINGPPLALLYQHDDGDTVRATLAAALHAGLRPLP